MMRATSIVIAVFALASAALGQLGAGTNGIVAVVNEEVITHYDIAKELRRRGIDLDSLKESDREAEYRLAVRDKVFEILQRQATEAAGIELSEEEFINRRTRFIEGFETEEKFRDFLNRSGISEREWNENFRAAEEARAWRSVMSGLASARSPKARPRFDVSATPREMREYYLAHRDSDFTVKDEAHVQVIQIYFKRGDRIDKTRKHQLMLRLKAKLATKADFAVLARQYNKNPATQDTDGDLGWIEKGSDALREELAELVFDPEVRPGQVIGPVESLNSFWLIRVRDLHRAHVKPFEEVQDEVRGRIMAEKRRRAISRLIADLVRQSYIHPVSLKRQIEESLRAMR